MLKKIYNQFIEFDFSENIIFKLFALQFLIVFNNTEDWSTWLLHLIAMVILIFNNLSKYVIPWLLAIVCLSFKLFQENGWYFFREVDAILLFGTVFIAISVHYKNSKYLGKVFSFYLALMMLNAGLGKLIIGRYADGSSLFALLNKDMRVASPFMKIGSEFSSRIYENRKAIDKVMNSYLTGDDIVEAKLLVSSFETFWIQICSILIPLIEVGLGLIGLYLLFSKKIITGIKDYYFLGLAGFITVTYPIVTVIHMGIAISLFSYVAAGYFQYKYKNIFLILFFYVLVTKIRYFI